MKCQHCGSTDVILIQGQNYCLNCGYAVATPAPTDSAAPKTGVALAKASPKAAKSTSTKTVKSSSAKKTSVSQAQRPVPSGGTVLIPSTPSRSRDGRPADSRTTNRSKLSASSRVHPLQFSLAAALIAAAVSGSVTAVALWLHVDSDTGAYVIVATMVGLGILISLAHTALLYGRSRSQDGRPATREYWWMAARGGFMDVVNVQLIAIICALVLFGVGLALWQLVGTTHWGVIVSGTLLGLVNLALIWALLGVYAAARLATPAVVIGGLRASEAVLVGWRLYLKAGGHLVAASVEALFGRAIAAVILAVAGYAAVTGVTTFGTTAEAVGGGLGVALVIFCACMLTLEVDTKLWLAQYRHLATLCSPAERIRLLTGRVQSHTAS